MKYTGRILTVGVVLFSGALFKIYDYISLGYIPLMEWILNALFVPPSWWIGLQIDKARFYAKEVKKKEEELNGIFENVDAVIYSFDFQTEKLLVSEQVFDLYGYPAKAFKENKRLWKDVLYHEDVSILLEINQELKKGKAVTREYRIQLPNGELKWIQRRSQPILNSSGQLIKVNGIDIDIDHRKKMEALLKASQEENRQLLEKRLEASEQRFKSLFVNNSDAVFMFNLEGKLVEINQAAVELTGYTFEESKNKDWSTIICPEDRDSHWENLRLACAGERQEFTLSFKHKDGGKREAISKMIPIIKDNQFLGIYEIAKDITESKLAEEMIRRSDKLSVVGQLAAGVAHEIRNPLTTLKGFIQFFQADIDRRFVDVMLAELDRINLIVSEFLVLSKPQVISYENQDIKQIINDIMPLLEPHAMSNHIQFILEFENELPSVLCEQNQLKQVFINLLKNAIEAMPSGGEIVIQAKVKNEEQDQVSILIIDQGLGIEEGQIPKLGEPFFTTKEEGTGLGLMVSMRIIENHGGLMKISSELNKGTAIEICLPLKQV